MPTVKSTMRTLAQLLFDVAISIAAVVIGAMIHQVLGLGVWFAPASMLPFIMWLWWRGVLPPGSLPVMLVSTGLLSGYFAIKNALWPNQPNWGAVDTLVLCVMMQCAIKIIGWRSEQNQNQSPP